MASESSLNSSESIALKALSGVGLAIFTALMIVHWNNILSKVEVAEKTAPAVTPSTTTNAAAAPPVPSTSGVAPAATSTSAIATNSSTATPSSSTTLTPSTPTSSATAPITTTPTTPTSESATAAPATPTATAPITTATPSDSTTAPAPESATPTTSTPVETVPTEPNTLAAVESTPATDTTVETTTATGSSGDVATLKTQLYNTLDQAWTQYPSFSQDLVYKVTVGGDGSIVGYQPIHQAAVDYLNETPLDGMSANSAASGTDFMVIMTPDGLLEVNPWIGK